VSIGWTSEALGAINRAIIRAPELCYWSALKAIYLRDGADAALRRGARPPGRRSTFISATRVSDEAIKELHVRECM